MPLDHLVIANMKTGYETDRTPFIIDNDAFPVINNAYIWRGRMLRKRGTAQLGRLQRNLIAVSLGNSGASPWTFNIFTLLSLAATQPNAAVIPGTVSISIATLATPFTDNGDGTLSNATPGNSGVINYATGVVTLTDTVGAGHATTITFSYYPILPVLGLEDFDIGTINEPIMISFDQKYSYGFNQGTNLFYDVTFYKSTGDPFTWNGPNYRQFYTTNYLGVNTIADSPDKTGCLWATNGNPGFFFITITNVTVAAPDTDHSVSTITTSAPHNLTNNDFVFINEVQGVFATAVGAGVPARPAGTFGGINGASGKVTVTGANTFTLSTPYTNGMWTGGGIVEYITQSSSTTADGIRWYDGDPTTSTNFGWVNFAPPLNQFDATLNPNPFYLVGADIITPFKNRLIFSGVYLTNTSIYPSIQYFPNRIVYSQVGTPYYTRPLPFPISTQLPDPTAWFQNIAGKGGFLTAPIDQEILTVAPNEDVLIYGFEMQQLKLFYTFDDSFPFVFYTINSEYGSNNTFSAVVLDAGVISIGSNGIIMTTQNSCQRIDLQIPDQVFDIQVANNKNYRVCAIRDFRNEWIYFTYCPASNDINTFNSQTLLYNYRDNNWATFDENYTHYGTFRRSTNQTWASIGTDYPEWDDWDDQWNSGINEAFFPQIVGGNQQGFVIKKAVGTDEAQSQYISAVNISTNVITSPDHCLSTGDFIEIFNMIGITVTPTANIFKVRVNDINTFTISNSEIPFVLSGAYLGGGTYKRFSIPFVQSKQFPIYWKDGRGCRVGTQRYLLQTTDTGQISAQVYSSQNSDSPDNQPGINPYLVFSDVVLTSPEPNLYGTDPAYSGGQEQIWHRQSNSFNGDTIQLGFTLNDEQMFDPTINTEEIILHAIVLDLYPGPIIA
jgi:hypothetical protein